MDKPPRMKFLEVDQVQRILEQPSHKSATGLRNRCIMGLMYESGLRISEVLSLKPRDVVLEEKRVEVLRGKGAKPRTVYFRSNDLASLIEKWKRERPQGEYLFCTVKGKNKGGALSPWAFRNTFRTYVKKAGMDPLAVTPHVLRHTYATEKSRRGDPIRSIQKSLGHAWVSTTQLYTHVPDEDVRNIMTS